MLALLYHFRLGREGTWWHRVLVPAGWFALAVLSKASGPVFGLIGLSMVELEYRLFARADAESGSPGLRTGISALWQRSFRRDVIQIYSLGLIAVFWYCGSDWRASPSFVAWAHQLPEGYAKAGMVWFAENLRIFSNAGVALVRTGPS